MPLYEYQCVKCKKRFEKIEKLSAPKTQKCPHCGGKAERQLSAPGIQFKGSGWYVTDYARSSGSAAKSDDAAPATGDSKEAAKETKEVKDSKETKEGKEARPKKDKKHK